MILSTLRLGLAQSLHSCCLRRVALSFGANLRISPLSSAIEKEALSI